MNRKKTIGFVLICSLIIPASGCGAKTDLSEAARKVVGSWAYNHEKTVEIASFSENGKAKYGGADYTFEADETYITLTGSDGKTEKLRYSLEDNGMLLYKNTEYTRTDGEEDSIIGQWTNPNNWSFEFTATGTFLEDGYFPGYYTENAENKTVKLVYNDQFEDTVIYYQLDSDKLLIEYPWKVVKTEKK